ncbi:hypothetical protein ACFW15_30910, partial [Streptomyces sp. NPDC058953]
MTAENAVPPRATAPRHRRTGAGGRRRTAVVVVLAGTFLAGCGAAETGAADPAASPAPAPAASAPPVVSAAPPPSGAATPAGSLLVADFGADTVTFLDPARGPFASVRVGTAPYGLAVGADGRGGGATPQGGGGVVTPTPACHARGPGPLAPGA